jgi:DNA mismatch repair ATPase MutS
MGEGKFITKYIGGAIMFTYFNSSEFLKFILGFSCVLFIIFISAIYQESRRLKMIKRQIISQYGKPIDIYETMINMKSVSSFFRNKSEGVGIIDDITWNDLNMDDIFKTINNTQSTAGREMLYIILRDNNVDKTILIKRDKVIEYFRQNEEDRFKVQYILAKLGISKDLYTTSCLYNDPDESKNRLWIYRILSYMPIALLFMMFVSKWFVLFAILSVGVNVGISLKHRVKKLNVDGYSYLIRLINNTNLIKKLNLDILANGIKKIEIDLKKLDKIKGKSVESNPNNLFSEVNIFNEYINLIFLRELKIYEMVKERIIKNKDNLMRIYEYVGELDALIAVASYRDSLKYYVKPDIETSVCKFKNRLEFEDLYHPLIENPVVNSGKFYRGALITGSNASGKSTFIKTVAVNAILAQTIYTTCSKKYISSKFNIYTSMALKDDILSSESYFMVEIRSLKRIVDNVNSEKPTLCFVDEILRGTNTIERIASSCEVLGYLSQGNCLCFAATHDIELTHLLEGKFDNYHFEENITDKDIKFDYKLHSGRAQSRNAIKLLSFMGYDADIVEKASNRAADFINTGKW